MGKELMAKQPMEELGFRPSSSSSKGAEDARAKRREEEQKEKKEERVAGLRTTR
jgi:hypothetical protein